MLLYLLAQAAAAAAPEAVQTAQQGVTSYPPSFFAAQQPNSALDMLRRVPGFSVDTGDSVRGFEGAAGNVLIDGQRPSSKNDNLQEVLQRLPASQVERIDIIRGGAPGIDMQGKTVLANIIRKQGRSFRGLAAVANTHVYDGRNAPSVRLEASGDLGEGRKFEVSARGGVGIDDGNGDGPGTRVFADGSPTIRTRIESEGDVLQGIAAGVYETPLAGGKARINVRILKDKYKGEENDYLLAPASGAEFSVDYGRTFETEIGGRFSRSLGTKTTFEGVVLRQDRHRKGSSFFDDGDRSAFFLDRDTSETIGRMVLKNRWSDTVSLEGGGEVAVNKLDSRTIVTVNGAAIPIPAANVRVKESRAEAFAKATWRPSAAWTVDGGVRLETSRIASDGDVRLQKTLRFVKPRVAVTWQATPGTQIRLRAEREVGQLNFDDFVASSSFSNGAGVMAGNPDIEPQKAWVLEGALEQRFWEDGAITLTGRHYELSDVIDRGPVFTATSVFDTPQNIGRGTRDELSAEVTVPLSHVGLNGAQFKGDVTRRWSEVTDPTTGEDRRISGQRPIEWSVAYTHDVSKALSYGISTTNGWREASYRFNAVQFVKLKVYVIANVEWRPAPEWNVNFTIQNLTERGLRLTRYSYAPTRAVSGRPNVDDRDLQFGRLYNIRIRKTFGG